MCGSGAIARRPNMISVLLCLLAFVTSYLAGRRSLVAAVQVVLAVGYGYGILRANLLQPLTYFVFDSAVLGLYLAYLAQPRAGHSLALRVWVLLLAAWPTLLLLSPQQDLLVRMVGWRGNVFYLPLLLIGAQLSLQDYRRLAEVLAVLNLAALGFAVAEYLLGVPRFYPYSAVTRIIYDSNDVAGYQYLRIPGTFANAHSYGSAMVGSLSLLVLSLLSPSARDQRSDALLMVGVAAAIAGIFLCAARTPVGLAAVLLVATLLFAPPHRAGLVALLFGLLCVGLLAVAGNPRLSRAFSLLDTEAVATRVGWSVNEGFFPLLWDNPVGAGLGSGGTSIPNFLGATVRKAQHAAENEYARIALEQGWIGLLLFLGFLLWVLLKPAANPQLHSAHRVTQCYLVGLFVIAATGIGTFLAVPAGAMILLCLGFLASTSTASEQVAAGYGAARPLPA